jgi:TatD DNase family protein
MQTLIDIHTHQFLDTANSQHILNVFAQNLPLQEKVLPKTQKISIGLHPWHIQQAEASLQTNTMLENMTNAAAQAHVFAIGETGLDKLLNTAFALQETIFRQHIALSENCQKPLIIHSLKTYNEILAIRKKTQAKQAWLVHGFNGNELIAKQLIALGCYLSFGHLLLNPQTKAYRVFASLPLRNCFLETDDNPTALPAIYEQAAKLKNISVATLAVQLYQNFEYLQKN